MGHNPLCLTGFFKNSGQAWVRSLMMAVMTLPRHSKSSRTGPTRWLLPATLALGLCLQSPVFASEVPANSAPSLSIEVHPAAPIQLESPQDPAVTDAAAKQVTADFDMSTMAWRHGQLQVHQALGLSTLAAMAVTGGLGYWVANQNGSSGVLDAHLLMAGLTTGLYLTSATLALTVPPLVSQEPEGPWDTVGLHRKLAWLHAAGLASTLTLGFLTNYSSLSFSQYHAVAAYSTIALMALSAGVIAFGE
jgi:hypothetical protein